MICFIILHYNAIDETKRCVESIQQNSCDNYKIIIVDNFSSNKTGVELQKKYEKNDKIDVILSDENLGFAKGNNLGYNWAKKYNPDFMVILNSDIVIKQKNFCQKIYDIYDFTSFDVLGPSIYCPPLGIYQNPKRVNHYTEDEIRSLIQKYEKKCKHPALTKIKCYLKNIKFLKRIVHKYRKKSENQNIKDEQYNVILHGSCIIVSKKFINKRKYCFNPGTFMYYEMEILDYESNRDNLSTLYSPKIEVIHNHNASTNYTFKNEYKKVCFMNNCILNSLKIFIDILKSDK